MASNGSFLTTASYNRSLKFSWSIQSQSIANNTTTITWSLTGAGSASGYVVCGGFKVVINGETVYEKSTNHRVRVYNGDEIASGTHTISHNSDGTKTFSASAQAGIYTYAVNCSGSGSWALTTIPRTSSYSLSATSVEINKSITINITRSSSSFTHYVKLWCDWDNYYVEKSGVGTSTTITIPTSWYSATNGASSITAYCRVDTYSGSTFVGRALDKSFTVTVPSGTGPSIGSFTLDPVDINSQNILVQTKNGLTIAASGCTGGFGTSVSYKISGSDISAQNASSVTAGPFYTFGTKTYTLTITDAGGRTATKSASVTCYEYSSPSISLSAYRVKDKTSTTEDDSGTYVRCAYNVSYASVNNTNDITVKIFYKKNSVSSWSSVTALTDSTSESGYYVLSGIEAASTYTVYATVTDNYSGSSESDKNTVFSAERILNIRPQGAGIAFGKMADTNNVLDSKWPIRTDAPEQTMKNLTYKGSNLLSTTDDTTENWANMGNIATVYYNQTDKLNGQPSQYGYLLNLTVGPGSTQVHHLWAEQANGSLFHRGGNTSGLYAWKEVLDTSNCPGVMPTTLYSTSAGNAGTITLSESAANFNYLEIFYTDNTSRQPNSVRIYSPNGKYVSLSCIEPSTTNTEMRLYIRTSGWTISGTSMTVGRSDLSGANRGVYAQLYTNAGGINTDVNITANNYIKIFRVIGYK